MSEVWEGVGVHSRIWWSVGRGEVSLKRGHTSCHGVVLMMIVFKVMVRWMVAHRHMSIS